MPNEFADRLVILNGASYSNSIHPGPYALVGFRVPQFAATTAALYFETTEDGLNVADADAVWDPVFDQEDARVKVPVSTSVARRAQIDTPASVLQLGRFRVQAVTSGGVGVVQDAAKTIVPKYTRSA